MAATNDIPIIVDYNYLSNITPAIGNLGGSNPKWTVTYNNKQYVLKNSNGCNPTADIDICKYIAATEVLTYRLFKLANILVPNLILVKQTSPSDNDKVINWYVMSEFMDDFNNFSRDSDEKKSILGKNNKFDLQQKIHKTFYICIWLSYRDIKFDNIGYTKENNLVFIDVGGSLNYKSQGKKKPQDEFSNIPK